MVDVELLGEFAMIVPRDCEAWQSVSQEMLDSAPVGRRMLP
jgi:hypothetical protein